MDNKKKPTKKKEISKATNTQDIMFGASFVFNFGFMILVPTLLGLWLGLTLDNRFDTKPWLTLIGIVLGNGIGFYSGAIQMKKFINRGKKL